MTPMHPVIATRSLSLDFDSRRSGQTPFARSIRLVLDTALQQHGADVACLYQLSPSEDTLDLCGRSGRADRRLDSAHIELSSACVLWLRQLRHPECVSGAGSDVRVCSFPEVLLHGLDVLLVTPLRIDGTWLGVLTAGWRGASSIQAERAAAGIGSAGAAATALLIRIRESASALMLAQQVASAEAELADIKIADRSTGLTGAADQLRDHIDRVLQGSDSAALLKRQLEALQQQLRDRDVLTQAKARLQALHSLTEEQAYLHLRNSSRRQRRPIRDVAAEVLNGFRNEPSDRLA